MCAHLAPLARAQLPASETLRDAPLELAGDWGSSPRQAVGTVVERVRGVCLAGLRLLSDRQPTRLRVDNHQSGPPAIWLHDNPSQTAWIIVNIGPADWSKLAYQFGHELGHVICNSWDRGAVPDLPSQWLEEALAEAFSIRGLGLLAASWERDPPFSNDAKYAVPLRQYRQALVTKYKPPSNGVGRSDLCDLLRADREALESGRMKFEGAAIIEILTLMESDIACVEDLGAVNRWPERSHSPFEDYLVRWQASCAEIGAPGRLPLHLRNLLRVDI
jgi:hypothetical protein